VNEKKKIVVLLSGQPSYLSCTLKCAFTVDNIGQYVVNIALIMEAVITSETSVCFIETTRRFIAESCHIQYLTRFKVILMEVLLVETLQRGQRILKN
jgi:hypothetical protein